MADKITPDWRSTVKDRLTVLAVIFACWTVAIVGRLFFLQVISHADLVARADRQQNRTVVVAAKRGEIYDRNGRLLAYSVDADTIYAVPSELTDPPAVASTLCRALDDCDRKEQAALAERLAKGRAPSST